MTTKTPSSLESSSSPGSQSPVPPPESISLHKRDWLSNFGSSIELCYMFLCASCSGVEEVQFEDERKSMIIMFFFA